MSTYLSQCVCILLPAPLPAIAVGSVFSLETCHWSSEENSKRRRRRWQSLGLVGGISEWCCWMEDLQKAGVPKILPALEGEGGKSQLCFPLTLLRPDLAHTPPSQSCDFFCSYCFYIWSSTLHMGFFLLGLHSRQSLFLSSVRNSVFSCMISFPTTRVILMCNRKISVFL